MLSIHSCVSDQNPQLTRAVSVPLELGKKVEQAAHVAWRQRSQYALFPCPCQPRAGLVMMGYWQWRRRLRREGLYDLYSVTWSHVGFLFQFEKITVFSLPSNFTLRLKMKILVEHSEFTVFFFFNPKVFIYLFIYFCSEFCHKQQLRF